MKIGGIWKAHARLTPAADQSTSIYYLHRAKYQAQWALHFDVSLAPPSGGSARAAAPLLFFDGPFISLSVCLACNIFMRVLRRAVSDAQCVTVFLCKSINKTR